MTVDGVADHAQVFLRPADDATEEDVRASLYGFYVSCAPLLGSPTGGSPACDRVLVRDPVTVEVPPGRYDVFATAGIFATVARETVELAAGDAASVELALERLDVAPAGTLSADFHVHGAASFDSTVPDFDRVQAFLAANIDVIAATDHDVVWDYADARGRARRGRPDGDHRRARGHRAHPLRPDAGPRHPAGHRALERVAAALHAGRPVPRRALGRARGAGAPLHALRRGRLAGGQGVIQLNHPWAAAQFGRDLGFPRAVGVDARVPLPREYDGTGPGLILRTPPGASFSNADYHTQEVMNGTENEDLLPYRAYWFYLLNQGIVRAGTANSDSHGLVDNVLGTPRTLVWTDQRVGDFDPAAFNAAGAGGADDRDNGPVIEVATTDASGATRGPRWRPSRRGSDADALDPRERRAVGAGRRGPDGRERRRSRARSRRSSPTRRIRSGPTASCASTGRSR